MDARRLSPSKRGYDSAWDTLRVQAFIRDGWTCVECGWYPDLLDVYRAGDMGTPSTHEMLGVLTARQRAHQRHLHGDHIQKISSYPDRRLDLTNIQTLCNICHARKTLRESVNPLC